MEPTPEPDPGSDRGQHGATDPDTDPNLFAAAPSEQARALLARLIALVEAGELQEPYRALLPGGSNGRTTPLGYELSDALARQIATQVSLTPAELCALPERLGVGSVRIPPQAAQRHCATDENSVRLIVRGRLARMVAAGEPSSAPLLPLARRESAQLVARHLGQYVASAAGAALCSSFGGSEAAVRCCAELPGAPADREVAVSYAAGLLAEHDWRSLFARELRGDDGALGTPADRVRANLRSLLSDRATATAHGG